MIDALATLFAQAHTALFESVVIPALSMLGLEAFTEDAFDFTEWFLIGVLEIGFLAAVLLPLERFFPAERRGPGAPGDQARIDLTYTLLHRLGGFAIFVFAVLTPLVLTLKDTLRAWGFPSLELDAALGLTYSPVLAAVVYLVILDFVDYWMHRFQHQWNWWWALHAVHHAQRRMTLWSDNRNHLIDDLIRDAVLAFVAIMIGVMPAQFLGFVVVTRIWQSLQHANLGIAFPGWLARTLVSPGFHRLHHGVGIGHEGPARGVNFAVIFPVWDWIFRTADWSAEHRLASGRGLEPTGIRDQEQGVNYGRGFWEQQWIGVRNLIIAVKHGIEKRLA
jgi:sterol desaturase/sphingolipid hydroxylase (fatty acid hydroxylase superfamily)